MCMYGHVLEYIFTWYDIHLSSWSQREIQAIQNSKFDSMKTKACIVQHPRWPISNIVPPILQVVTHSMKIQHYSTSEHSRLSRKNHSQLLLHRLRQMRIIHNRIEWYFGCELFVKVGRIDRARLKWSTHVHCVYQQGGHPRLQA